MSNMTGIEQLRAFMSEASSASGIGKTLDFRIIRIEEGRVVVEGHPDQRVYNPIGTVHGGYAATLLDSALGCAVHSKLKAGQGYTTLDLQIAYHRAMTQETGPVQAEGVVTTFGRRAAFAEGHLTDAQGRIYATATSTLLVFER